MTDQFKPYPGFDPMEGDEPGTALSRDNPVRPMTEEEVERAHDEAAAQKRCSMGVGCDEAGVCYAAAHGKPEECPRDE